MTFQIQCINLWIDGADKLVENDYSGRVSTPGEYTMLLSVSDGGKSDESFLYDPHAVCYDAYETTLELVSGDPFEITSVTPSTSWGTYSYNMGQRLTLKPPVEICDEPRSVNGTTAV